MAAVRQPVRKRGLQRAGQFTALVDILFATIGIFVIVFALQELATPSVLRPAPYDALLLCGSDRAVRLYRMAEEPMTFGARQIEGPLADEIEGSGRVLIGVSPECATEADGVVMVDRLRKLIRGLSDRQAEGDALDMFEFAPLGGDGTDARALLDRFGWAPGGTQ